MSVFRGAAGSGGKLTDGSGNPLDLSASKVHRLAASANSQNETRIKAEAGVVDALKLRNTTGATILVRFFDSAANPPDNDAVTVLDVFEFPANAITAYAPPAGVKFATGIGYAIVAADGTTAVAAGAAVNLSIYWR